MSLTAAIAVYFVIWWLVLFAILPWGVRTQGEAGTVEPGSPESAPVHPHLVKKALITSLVAAILLGVVYVVQGMGWLDFSLPDRAAG
jgi:predicted secreted protein